MEIGTLVLFRETRNYVLNYLCEACAKNVKVNANGEENPNAENYSSLPLRQ